MPDAIFEHPRLVSVYDALDPDRSDLDVYAAIADELGARCVLDVGRGAETFVLDRLALVEGGRGTIALPRSLVWMRIALSESTAGRSLAGATRRVGVFHRTRCVCVAPWMAEVAERGQVAEVIRDRLTGGGDRHPRSSSSGSEVRRSLLLRMLHTAQVH